MAHGNLSADLNVTTTGDVSTLLTESTSDLEGAAAGGSFLAFAYGEFMSEIFSATPDATPAAAPTNTVLDMDLPSAGGEMIVTGTGFTTANHGTISHVNFLGGGNLLDIQGNGTWTATSVGAMHATSMEISAPGIDFFLKGNVTLDPSGDITGTATEERVSANGITLDLQGQLGVEGDGFARTITVDDGAGNMVTIQGQIPSFVFGEAFGTASTIGDFVNNPVLLIGNDRVTGTANDDVLVGGDGHDQLFGLAGSDSLDGGTGGDIMRGGLGDDTYFVDNAADSVVETSGQGHDTVFASANYTLDANVEDLVLRNDGLHGTGNSLVNVITGGTGNDVLDSGVDSAGLAGETSSIGGLGDDSFIIHSFADVIIENSGEGNDTAIVAFNSAHNVTSTIDLALSPQLANVENVTIRGTGLFNINGDANDNHLIGNKSVNVISGNDGDDFLQGGFGADTLTGGAGADTFSYGAGEGHSSSNADLITDFTTGLGGDALDIQNLISGYHPGVSALSDFVHATQVGGDTIISVASGHHGHFTDIATLQGVTNLDLNQMILDGNLLIAPPN